MATATLFAILPLAACGAAPGTDTDVEQLAGGEASAGSTATATPATEPTTTAPTPQPTVPVGAGGGSRPHEPSGAGAPAVMTAGGAPAMAAGGASATQAPTPGAAALTEEQRATFDEQGWVAIDIAPVDCSAIELDAAAIALADDFSLPRSSSAADHRLVMDLGSVVRRVDTYFTDPATDGHRHELRFADEALAGLLAGTSLVTRTQVPPLDGDDTHGHTITVHSCGPTMYQ